MKTTHSTAHSDLRTELYPPANAYRNGTLAVDDLHTLYWEEAGNPDGVPVVVLHGGPGAGCSPTMRRFFDPGFFRVVLFDQRGAGRSTPHGELRDNTTDHLVADIEKLREHLQIDKWHVFGGSWGSTLGLAYAQAHPQSCLSLVLRGIFLMQQKEIDWFMYGMGKIFPEAWEAFAGHLPEDERGDLLNNYYHRLTSEDDATRIAAGKRWSVYESSCCNLIPDPDMIAQSAEDRFAVAISSIEAHYFLHNAFTPETRLLDDIDRIRDIPAVIVQGRYDIVCPPSTAFELHARWPEAELVVVQDAGHSAFDTGIRRELVAAMERLKTS